MILGIYFQWKATFSDKYLIDEINCIYKKGREIMAIGEMQQTVVTVYIETLYMQRPFLFLFKFKYPMNLDVELVQLFITFIFIVIVFNCPTFYL